MASGRTRARRSIARSAALAALCASTAAFADPDPAPPTCVPARIAPEAAAPPAAWQKALEDLAASTAREGLPWSCPGGAISLALDPDGARGLLIARDPRGRETSRPVESPADVGPTGKALLAGTAAPPAPPSAPPAPPPPPARKEPPLRPAAPASRSDPRLLLWAAVGPRYSGPSPMGWLSGSVRAAVPIQRWSIGLWARADLPVAQPASLPAGFEASGVSVGLSGARSFQAGPVELTAMLDPSLAVVSMEATLDESKPHPEGSAVDFRVGSVLAASLHLASLFRGALLLDGEIAPSAFGTKPIAPGFPSIPGYTLGMSLAVEAVVR
jgi:hypothetical protein